MKIDQIATHLPAVDFVLGGGLVRRGAVLIYGPEGAGKTTLALGMARSIAQSGTRALYISTDRMELGSVLNKFKPYHPERPTVMSAIAHGAIVEAIENDMADVYVVDDVHRICLVSGGSNRPLKQGSPRSIDCACATLKALADKRKVAVIVLGRESSGGGFARPSATHCFDVVLTLRPGPDGATVLAGQKNRFAPMRSVTLAPGLSEIRNAVEAEVKCAS